MVFELGELIPLFAPASSVVDNPTESDCKTTLHFNFNCTSNCISTGSLLSRLGYIHDPLFLNITAFLVRRTGEVIQPIKQFARNFVIFICDEDLTSDETAGPGTRGDTSRRRPPSPEFYPGRTVNAGTISAISSAKTRRASKRKSSSKVHGN